MVNQVGLQKRAGYAERLVGSLKRLAHASSCAGKGGGCQAPAWQGLPTHKKHARTSLFLSLSLSLSLCVCLSLETQLFGCAAGKLHDCAWIFCWGGGGTVLRQTSMQIHYGCVQGSSHMLGSGISEMNHVTWFANQRLAQKIPQQPQKGTHLDPNMPRNMSEAPRNGIELGSEKKLLTQDLSPRCVV